MQLSTSTASRCSAALRVSPIRAAPKSLRDRRSKPAPRYKSAPPSSDTTTAKSTTTMPQPLIFVTGNAGKLREVKAILGDSVPWLENRALDLPELQGSLEEITLDKARRAAEEVRSPAATALRCRAPS